MVKPRSSESLARPRTQREQIRDFMIEQKEWLSLLRIAYATGFGEASVSAQLRHLRKAGRLLEKRYRGDGVWEYRLC